MDILSSRQQGILTLEFNRPDKKNAITAAMYQSLAAAFDAAEADAAVRVILLSGKTEVFTAGYDLEDFLQHPPHTDDSPVLQFLNALSRASKPVVAAVSGAAVGIGVTLLLHCDLVYAAEKTWFSLPFTQLGLCPEAAASLLLPQLAGYQRAAEKLLLGEAFTVEEAQAMGLVNQILPAAQLLAFATSQAGKLADLPLASVQITKRLMKEAQQARVAAQMAQENACFRRLLAAPAAQQTLAAFVEKRAAAVTRKAGGQADDAVAEN